MYKIQLKKPQGCLNNFFDALGSGCYVFLVSLNSGEKNAIKMSVLLESNTTIIRKHHKTRCVTTINGQVNLALGFVHLVIITSQPNLPHLEGHDLLTSKSIEYF